MESRTAFLLSNYWKLFVALSFVYMFFPQGLMSLVELYFLAVFFTACKPFQFTKLDWLVCFYMAYCLMSCTFSDYPFSVFFYGVRWSLFPMLMYFVARSLLSIDYLRFFWGLRIPVLFACFCGVFLYVVQPGFYVDFKYSNIDLSILSGDLLMEITRFSSFWTHSYCISYLCLFLLLRNYKLMVFDQKLAEAKGKKLLCETVFLLAIIVVAQQRVVIAYSVLAFGVFFAYSFLMKNGASSRMSKLFSVYLLVAVLAILFASVLFDAEFIDYVINRSVGYEGDEGMVEDRVALFGGYIDGISFFGEGFGKYGHAALKYKMPSITDCDYIRISCEIGIFGLSVLSFIFLVSLLKGVRIFHKVPVETLIVAFYPMAMIGAAPMYVTYMHPCVLWFCMGRIGLLYHVYCCDKEKKVK